MPMPMSILMPQCAPPANPHVELLSPGPARAPVAARARKHVSISRPRPGAEGVRLLSCAGLRAPWSGAGGRAHASTADASCAVQPTTSGEEPDEGGAVVEADVWVWWGWGKSERSASRDTRVTNGRESRESRSRDGKGRSFLSRGRLY
jgi:hypothetical protein